MNDEVILANNDSAAKMAMAALLESDDMAGFDHSTQRKFPFDPLSVSA